MGEQSIYGFLDTALTSTRSHCRKHAGRQYRQTVHLTNNLWLTLERSEVFPKTHHYTCLYGTYSGIGRSTPGRFAHSRGACPCPKRPAQIEPLRKVRRGTEQHEQSSSTSRTENAVLQQHQLEEERLKNVVPFIRRYSLHISPLNREQLVQATRIMARIIEG